MFARTVVCIYDDQPTHKNQRQSTLHNHTGYTEYMNWEEEQQPENNQTTTITTTENQEQTINENTREQNPTITRIQNEETVDKNRNVTVRKSKQNTTTKTYSIEKQPPPNDINNYPQLNPENQNTEEITVITETEISDLQFMSPSMVTNNRNQKLDSTPETIGTSTLKVNFIPQKQTISRS